MAEDVKDDVTEIPTKRQKLDKDDDDYGIKQECTSSNNSATDKLVLSEDVPSTSRDNGPHAENELSLGPQQLPDPGDNMDDDSDSDMSDISGLSETVWKTTPGAMAWVHRQMMLGQNPRDILRDLISKDADIDDLDDYAIWEIIIRLLSEPPKRDRLEEYHTLDHAINLIKSCKKIVVLTGAGVSVSCGIPDFRSRDGIYARLAVDFPNLPDPQAMFDINFFSKDQRPFFKFAKEIYPGQFEPSRSHKFIRLLETHEKLLRNYTQNIDTLEQVAGIERVIQCHGSFATATCMACKHKVTADAVREDIFNQVIPKCTVCPEGTEMAIMKPDIVFFGESLPEEFHQQMAEDKQDCDLLIVIGSSLKVRPVALIPNSLPQNVPQILINREPLQHLNFDIELLGDCDVIISELCKRLKDGFQVLADSSPAMHEISRDQLRTPSPVPFPQKNPLESSEEDKVDSQEVPVVRAGHLSSVNDTEGQLETEKSSPSEGDKNKQDDAGKITNSENIENLACTDGLNSNSAASQCLESNAVQPPLENPMDEAMPCDSTTEELRSMWQPERVSLAKYLEDGQYVHLPPNRYAFPGAEIYTEGESEEEEEHFRNSISMSSSSSCSSLNSHSNVEQSDEENKSVGKQESNEEPMNASGKDSDDMSSDVRISSTDCGNSKHQDSRTSPTVGLNASSCHLDAEQTVVSQSCVGQTSKDVKLDIPSAQQPKDEDVALPDSSNSSM